MGSPSSPRSASQQPISARLLSPASLRMGQSARAVSLRQSEWRRRRGGRGRIPRAAPAPRLSLGRRLPPAVVQPALRSLTVPVGAATSASSARRPLCLRPGWREAGGRGRGASGAERAPGGRETRWRRTREAAGRRPRPFPLGRFTAQAHDPGLISRDFVGAGGGGAGAGANGRGVGRDRERGRRGAAGPGRRERSEGAVRALREQPRLWPGPALGSCRPEASRRGLVYSQARGAVCPAWEEEECCSLTDRHTDRQTGAFVGNRTDLGHVRWGFRAKSPLRLLVGTKMQQIPAVLLQVLQLCGLGTLARQSSQKK